MTPRPAHRSAPAVLPAVLGVLVVAALLAVAARDVPGFGTGLLHLAPALVLALPLLARRYVGEERLAGLARRFARRVRRRVARSAPRVRLRPATWMVRGGRLVGSGLSVRGPPLPA